MAQPSSAEEDRVPLPPWIDHIGSRLLPCLLVGSASGASLATLRNHSVRFYAISMGTSFMMCGTAVYGCERLVSWGMSDRLSVDENGKIQGSVMTHAIGGSLGGGAIGSIFRRSPWGAIPGAAMFALIGAGLGVCEDSWRDYCRDQRELRESENRSRRL